MDTEALKQQYDLLLDQNQPTMKLKLKPKDAEDPNQRIPIVLAPAQAVSELARLGVTGGLEFRPTSGSKRPDYIAATREGAEGIGTYCPKAFANSDPDNLKPANKLVFLVPENYFVYRHTGPKWNSSYPPDILILRSMMWHEVMEQAYIYISLFDIKRFNDPFRLKELIREGKPFNQNPIHYAVIAKQREFVKELKFYHWAIEPSDPPFCVSEKEALQHKRSAEDAQDWAEHYEGLVWRTAAEKWEEARKYWELVKEAWRRAGLPQSGDIRMKKNEEPVFLSVKYCHPDWENKVRECEDNAKIAEQRRDAALQETQQGATKPVPSWNVAGSGGEKITIHYSDWPNGFRAKILDYKERKVTEVSGTPGSKEGKVEWGKDADPGTYYVEVNVSGERSEKVIITKKLEWSACVKFGTNGPYISLTPKIGTRWPKGKGFGFSIHNSSGSTNKIGFVNVQDSNQTGEVTWGKESSQKFPKWGKYIIWAYAKDPGLQAMFEDKNFFPNWKTEVEIPVPSFKVNGAKASVAVAAKGPLIAPDTEQSLSIEYDNWPGKFKAKIRKKSSTQELVKLEGTSSTRGSFTRKVTLPTRAYYIEARPYGEGSLPLAIELTAANP